jgi:hypothetical protein
MTKKTVTTLALVTVLGLGIIGATSSFAQTMSTADNSMTSLVQKIATKFGLKQADVQAVFDEEHQAREAAMQAKVETQLSQFVTDGKITEAQKQLILQKRKELDAKRATQRATMQNLTPEERKSQMDAERAALDKWAQQNGIDTQYLMMFGGKGHHGFGFGQKPSDAPATTVAPTTAQ